MNNIKEFAHCIWHVCVLSCFSHVLLFETLWTDCSPPGSSDHGILQGKIVEWVAISYSRIFDIVENKTEKHNIWEYM